MMNSADSEIRTKGSLCSGTGALDRSTPGELAWVAEKEEAPAAVLKREHPDVPNHGDITVDPERFTHVDLLTSGDPCQSISPAGRQLASDDERFLWPDVMRIIDHAKPKHIFLENVQNITAVPLVKGGERGGVLKLRLDNLREAGYAVRWTVLGACAVGAPHHRHRWFLRAVYVGQGAPEAEWIVNKCGAPRNGGRLLLPSPTTADGSGGPGTSPKRTGGMNLRTAVTLLPSPTVADARNTRNATAGRRDGARFNAGVTLSDVGYDFPGMALLPTPTARDGDGRGEGSADFWEARRQERPVQGIPLGAEIGLLRAGWGKFAEAVSLWEQIIGRPSPEPTEAAPKGGRRLNAALSEWMMGYPEGYLTRDVSRNEALRMAGNGVVELQARAAWEMLG